jgi:two-component system LytT family response regulator
MKAVIIEDNPRVSSLLHSFIKGYHKNIEIVAIAPDIQNGKKVIISKRPEILFLDIQLGNQTVFQMLSDLDSGLLSKMAMIIISAYDIPEYLHKAIKYAAVGYVVKPIDTAELYQAMDKAIAKIEETQLEKRITQLEYVIKTMNTSQSIRKVPVHRVNGKINYLDTHDILYLSVEDTVVRIYLKNCDTIATSKPLKYYEEYLSKFPFFHRISQQIIVNLEHVKSFDPKENKITLHNSTQIQASRRKAKRLYDFLKNK